MALLAEHALTLTADGGEPMPEGLDTVVLEFLAVSNQRSFLKRGERLKFKSPPLVRADDWHSGPVPLLLDSVSHKVQVRIRVVQPGRRDAKSAPVDVALGDERQQVVKLSAKVDGRQVDAKVALTLTETEKSAVCKPEMNGALPVLVGMSKSDGGVLEVAARQHVCDDIHVAAATNDAELCMLSGDEVETAAAAGGGPTLSAGKLAAHGRRWWSFRELGSLLGRNAARTSNTIELARSLSGGSSTSDAPIVLLRRNSDLSTISGSAMLRLSSQRCIDTPADASKGRATVHAPAVATSSFANATANAAAAAAAGAVEPATDTSDLADVAHGKACPTAGKPTKHKRARTATRSREAMSSFWSMVTTAMASDSKKDAPVVAVPTAPAPLFTRIGAARPLPEDLLMTIQQCIGTMTKGLAERPSPRRAEYLASLKALLTSGVDEGTARAVLQSVTLELTPFNPGEHLGGGVYATKMPVRHPATPSKTAQTATAQTATAQTATAQPTATTTQQAAGAESVQGVADASGLPAARAEPRESRESQCSSGTASSGAQTAVVYEPLSGDTTNGELASIGSGSAGGSVPATPDRPDSGSTEGSGGVCVGGAPAAVGAPVCTPGAGACAPSAACAPGIPPGAPAAASVRFVSVTAVYSAHDQVSCNGEWACTCIALEVAAWLCTHPCTQLRGADLDECVASGCETWRGACAAGGVATCTDGLLGFHAALDAINARRAGAPPPAPCVPRCAAVDDEPCFLRRSTSAPPGTMTLMPHGPQLWEVEAAYSQVGPRGRADPATTFGTFAAAAAASAAAAGVPRAFVLVACSHTTVASFEPEGTVLLVNSLGRSLSPSCRQAHALRFSCLEDFVSALIGMVLPPGSGPTQVAAHRIADAPPAGGEPDMQLFMPQ